MVITTSKQEVHIRITNRDIEQKSEIKYLGVFIDEHLKWDAQIRHINNKLTKNIAILYKFKYYVSINMLKQLYYTFIYPYLTYGLMSWGTAYLTKLNRIKVSQNKCLRCILFANKRESLPPYYILLEILKLENVFKLKISTLVHKIQRPKKRTPVALSEMILPASKVHNYNTRYATNQNLYRPASRTYGIGRFKVLASKIWETILFKLK